MEWEISHETWKGRVCFFLPIKVKHCLNQEFSSCVPGKPGVLWKLIKSSSVEMSLIVAQLSWKNYHYWSSPTVYINGHVQCCTELNLQWRDLIVLSNIPCNLTRTCPRILSAIDIHTMIGKERASFRMHVFLEVEMALWTGWSTRIQKLFPEHLGCFSLVYFLSLFQCYLSNPML